MQPDRPRCVCKLKLSIDLTALDEAGPQRYANGALDLGCDRTSATYDSRPAHGILRRWLQGDLHSRRKACAAEVIDTRVITRMWAELSQKRRKSIRVVQRHRLR
jgi:hypothetical protein